MEREILFTGVGGQGVQLGAQVLARAAILAGRHVTLLGTYGGTMRGGNTDATLIVADEPVSTPPIVSQAGAAIAVHHAFWEPSRAKLRDGAVVVINESLFEGALDQDRHRVVDVPATELAQQAGSSMSASMVLVGAFAATTGLVELQQLIEGMRESVPAYRRQHLETNQKALSLGWEAGG